MSTQTKTSKPKFWLVFFGLMVLISLIGGGTYALNEAGLLGSSSSQDGDRTAPADFSEGETLDSTSFTPPDGMGDRPDGDMNSGALLGIAKAVGQLAIVITVVYYGQKLLAWLERRFRKPKLGNQAI
ncbi:MAG: hypothetical protein H6657_02080 [Ardenticatenaceae bacterium]|nr:hypothetical protein [Ardenticatenaceae bacterium]